MKKNKDSAPKAPKQIIPPAKVKIRQLPTGVRGLDEIMGGGLPEFSFNIIAGAPGCGKTTLAHQILFANATPQKPALYFTVLGEPALKMLRYQQQYTFFDPAKWNNAVRFINLSQVVTEKDLTRGSATRSVSKSKRAGPAWWWWTRSARSSRKAQGESDARWNCRRSSSAWPLLLTSWQATTFLIGEYSEGEMRDDPVFTVADSLFWLTRDVERNSVVRKLQILKLRGQASVPGLHTIRITDDGLQAFSRTLGLVGRKAQPAKRRRLSIGIPELDKMLGGGILEGDSVLMAGPSGTGKSALATQFIGRRAPPRRAGVIAAIFEERPRRLHRSGRQASAWTWTPRKRTESSKCSTFVPWTSRWMKPCRRSWTRSKGSMQSAW